MSQSDRVREAQAREGQKGGAEVQPVLPVFTHTHTRTHTLSNPDEGPDKFTLEDDFDMLTPWGLDYRHVTGVAHALVCVCVCVWVGGCVGRWVGGCGCGWVGG